MSIACTGAAAPGVFPWGINRGGPVMLDAQTKNSACAAASIAGAMYFRKASMKLFLRESQQSDLPFLREILYEAVFWRESANKPSFEEGLAYPDVKKALDDWGERDGDTAVVAVTESIPVGAAWYRTWTEKNFTRGFLDEDTPELVIGVHRDFRHQGVGTRMMEWLLDYASRHSVQRLSLSVSKDNYATNLYRQQGFRECVDKGDWFIMVRQIQPCLRSRDES